MSIRELKQNDEQNPHKIRFDSTMEILNEAENKKMVDKNFHFFILEECHPVIKEKKSKQNAVVLKPVLDCEHVSIYDPETKLYKFPTVQLISNALQRMENGAINLLDKVLVLEVHETFFETKKKGEEQVQKERFYCRTKLNLIDGLKFAKDSAYMLYLTDDKKKIKGKLYLDKFSIKSHNSFMDLYMKHSINIVPVIGVDFSLANLTLDES